LARRLGSSRDGPHRSRRRPLDRGHVPRGRRAPRLDPRARAGTDRPARRRRPRTDLEDRHRLFYYVPPHYSYIDKAIDKENKQQRITGKSDDEILGKLLRLSDRLCISEGPGAGKSVFTRRV
ncbi:MAG: hypothetical protein ACKOUR_06195, partial [Planctomycetota bacterium]